MDKQSLAAARRQLKKTRGRGNLTELRLLLTVGRALATNPQGLEAQLDEALRLLRAARALAERLPRIDAWLEATSLSALVLRSKQRGDRQRQYDEAIALARLLQ